MRVLVVIFMLASNCAYADSGLQRLFFTRSERADLERSRERAMRPEQFDVPVISGVVSRSDGRNTVWLDGVPLPASPAQTLKAARLGPEVPVNIRSTLKSSDLKAQVKRADAKGKPR